MSDPVTPDLVRGTLRRDVNGWSATRVFDVVVSPGGDPLSAPYRAATEFAKVPKYGDAHPVIPGIHVSSISVNHDETSDGLNYQVVADYSGDEAGTIPGLENTGIKGIDVSTSTVSARTMRDASGKRMIVRYEGPEFVIAGTAGGMWSPGTPQTTTQFVYQDDIEDVEYDLPTVTVTITRERSKPSHVASINSATLTNLGRWSGLNSKQWLSLGIDSTQNENGRFDWRYQFAVAPVRRDNMTWMHRAEPFSAPVVGRVRLDTSVGNGIEFFDIYRPVNFRTKFGFSIPS